MNIKEMETSAIIELLNYFTRTSKQIEYRTIYNEALKELECRSPKMALLYK